MKIKFILILITITFASCIPSSRTLNGDTPGTVMSIKYLSGNATVSKYEIIVWFKSPNNHGTNIGHEIKLRYDEDPNYKIGDQIFFRGDIDEKN